MLVLFYISFILSEKTTGFVIEEGNQLLELRTDIEYVDINRSDLLEKNQKTGDFIAVKKMDNKTRFFRSKKEYEDYLEKLEKAGKEEKNKKDKKDKNRNEVDKDEEDEEDLIREFNEIFVDISGIKKTNKIFGMKIECVKKSGKTFTYYSRPFTYSKKENQWKISDVIEKDSNTSYLKYGGIAIGGLFLIGVFAYVLS